MEAKFSAFEQLYKQHKQAAGPYLLGEDLSLAEIAFVPFLERFAQTLQFYRSYDLFAGGARYPTVYAAFEAARQRPAFKETTAPGPYFIQAYKGYAHPNGE